MTRSRFLTITVVLGILFIFCKIYQHNRIVKLMYEKQRINKKCHNLKRKKNDLLVQLYTLKDQHTAKNNAQLKLGMQQLQFSQVVSLRDLSNTNTSTIVKVLD